MRSPFPALLLVAGIVAAGPASAAEIVFYEHDAFHGPYPYRENPTWQR
jgi:hypothetical protein